jgi:hypothetical protein
MSVRLGWAACNACPFRVVAWREMSMVKCYVRFCLRRLWGSETMIGDNGTIASVKALSMKKTWRADFFDNWDDASPPRSMMICAKSEDEAATQMGNAACVDFIRVPRVRDETPPIAVGLLLALALAALVVAQELGAFR